MTCTPALTDEIAEAGRAGRGGGDEAGRANNLPLGALYTVLAMLGFAGMDAMSKWLVADYAIGQMMWIRYAVFCLFAWLVVRRKDLGRRSARAAPGCRPPARCWAVIESAIFVLAFKYLPLADAHALAATAPLIVIALGVLFLGERAGVARWLAVAAGFAGVLLIVHPGLQDARLAAAAAAARRVPVGRLSDPGAALLRARTCAETTLVWSAFAAFAATTRSGLPVAMAGRLQLHPARRHRAAGRAAHYALIKALDHAEASAVQPYSYTLLVWVDGAGRARVRRLPRRLDDRAPPHVASSLYAWHRDRRLQA